MSDNNPDNASPNATTNCIDRRRLIMFLPPSPRGVGYSRMVIPASLITGPHLSISDLRWAASSAGVDPTTTTPSCCSSRSLVTGSASAATVSACILAMISGEVLAGGRKGDDEDASKPETATCAIGGRAG